MVTPSHGYADYYYDAIGAWGVIEQWLTRLSGRATVYSFSQANDWVNEPITPSMAYWNDTFHFSLTTGRGILTSLAGLPLAARPDNFMERLTPERVAAHVENRRRAVRHWAQANPSFVARFEDARQRWLEQNRR